RRVRGAAAVADRRDAGDPGALRAGERALRPADWRDRGRVRSRLADAHLVLARGADVRVRGSLRAARGVDAAARDPQREHAQLGGLRTGHSGAFVVTLLRPVAD